MRVGIIRGDLPGPIHISDIETVSQYNPPIEPRGQERNISRPTTARLDALLANATTGAGAVIQSSDISGSFPITITGASNDTLKVRTSATGAFSTVTIAAAVYATITTLVAAVKKALTGTGVTAFAGTGSGARLSLEGPHGASAYVETATVANSAYSAIGLTATSRTTPTSAAFITALNPVSGTLNVANATISAVGTSTNSNALSLIPIARGTHKAIADAIAPQFVETPAVIDSYLVGMLSGYRSASYCPDARSRAAVGAAISVVQDDGSTAFSASLPTISSVTHNSPTSGDITIAGTGLGTFEQKDTVVKVATVNGKLNKRLDQTTIERAGGSITSTSIIVPASLLPNLVASTTAQVQVRQRATPPHA
jgi:hypothetical protein